MKWSSSYIILNAKQQIQAFKIVLVHTFCSEVLQSIQEILDIDLVLKFFLFFKLSKELYLFILYWAVQFLAQWVIFRDETLTDLKY